MIFCYNDKDRPCNSSCIAYTETVKNQTCCTCLNLKKDLIKAIKDVAANMSSFTLLSQSIDEFKYDAVPYLKKFLR